MTREEARQEINAQPELVLAQTNITNSYGRYTQGRCVNPDCSSHDAFTFYPETKSFYCFSCQCSGDTLAMLELIEGEKETQILEKYTSFRAREHQDSYQERKEAKPMQSEHPTERTEKPTESEEQKEYTSYYADCRNAMQSNTEAIAYLEKRGITLATANKYQIGYDAEQKRIIIPNSSKNYNARGIANQDEKYKYPKGSTVELWGAEKLYKGEPYIFAVEGSLDAISIEQSGYKAIALNSTSNANKLIKQLKTKLSDSCIIIALDNDDVGEKASKQLEAQLKEIGQKCIKADAKELYGNCKDANELLSLNATELEARLKRCTATATAPDRLAEYMREQYKAEIDSFRASMTNLSTGFEKLDYFLGGGLNVGLYVLGAISSLGKTTLVHQIADNIAQQKRDVLYFSLEMSRLELVTKSIAREQAKALQRESKNKLEKEGKASIEIRKGYGNEHTKEATAQYLMGKAQHMHIIEGNMNNCTADAICDYVTQFKLMNPEAKPVIFVDYLQIIQQNPTEKVVDTKTHLDRTIVKFKQLSRDINAPIFLISSINRANYLSLIDFESFKETGAIEYTADVILGLQLQVMRHQTFNNGNGLNQKRDLVRVAKGEAPRKIELVCLKNRYGSPSFTSYFEYYSKYDLFTETEEASEVLLFANTTHKIDDEYEDLKKHPYIYWKAKVEARLEN